MKGKKNLERAIILGLILSTGIYGSAWAETIRPISDTYNKSFETSVTIEGNDDTSAIEINDKNVSITTTNKDDGTITLESGKYGIRLDGNSTVTLNAAQDNKIVVELNKDDADGINSVKGANGTISLTADGSNIIETTGEGTDGIYTDTGNNTVVTLGATNNQITAGNNGIDHRGRNTVTLTATDGNIIDAGKAYSRAEGDGIRIQGDGSVELKGQYNKITASDTGLYLDDESGDKANITLTANGSDMSGSGYGNYIYSQFGSGVQSDAAGNISVTANAGANFVYGANNAVYNSGSGTITISATANQEGDITTLANIKDYDNVLIAGANGVQSDSTGATNVIADNNNIIAGTTNGILSDGAGTITVTAGNNNYIGQYTYKDENNNDVIVRAETGINIYKGKISITANNGGNIVYGNKVGVDFDTKDNKIYAYGNNEITGTDAEFHNGTGLNGINGASIEIISQNANNIITGGMSGVALYGAEATITASNGKNIIKGSYSSSTSTGGNALYANNNTNIHLNAQRNEAIARAGIFSENSSNVDLIATKNGNLLNAEVYGIVAQQNSTAKLTAYSGNNEITSGNYGIYAQSSSEVNLTTNAGNNKITASGRGIYSNNTDTKVILNALNNEIISNNNGIYAIRDGLVDVTSNYMNKISGAKTGIRSYNGNVEMKSTFGSNIIEAQSYGIYANHYYNDYDTNIVTLSGVNNSLTVTSGYGIYATGGITDVNLTAETNNNILSAKTTITDEDTGVTADYGQQSSVYALNGSNVDLVAGEQNYLLGAVYANGTGTNVNVKGKDGSTATNVIRSHAAIADAGDIDTTTGQFEDKTFYSALYAEDGAHIDVTGENYIGTYADSGNDDMLERTVWAYSGNDEIASTVNINGASIIGTDNYKLSPNSADVAIAAGTATELDKNQVDDFVNNPKAERSTVTFKYDNFDDGKSSAISGDILAAYAGLVDISTDNSEAGINITGNLLAGNNGILSVDLGRGGVLTGRADDYGDAGYVENGRVGVDSEGNLKTFYNPAFSSTIYSGGNVGLEMGAGSRWNVTGQSWITSIDTSDANGNTQDTRATIDLVNYYKDETGENNTNAHALTVYDFNGSADFIMNLDGNRTNSDMLYMKRADGTYRINLVDAVTTDEINSDQNGNEFSGLRFATVGNENSDVTFLVGSYDNGGAFNVEYEVGTDEYGGAETAHENNVYNGDSLNSGKPGSDMVDGFFGSDGEPVSSDNNTESGISTMDLQAANNIMLMSEEAATLDETAAAANDAADYNATNHKIIARLGEEISDTGKTILNMSRANYSNAIYMDRLNKRLGEARYINSEEDEGMWVRIRHDRIGKDDAYRSQNTMYELGYDQKQECDNGERRVGMAIDYMHGDTGYDQIAGKGEIDRYGLWLYDTWMGDKGHYADYVAKWGHLSNDFEVYTMNDKTKQVTGDYSNNVFSVSAEYGRKKDIGNDWYFEPQVQAQLARVTGADYTTNQGTKVSVDGINSLIGRAGFRLGKDFGEEKQSTVYIKADVLHEFLGDQDVRVLDKSSDNKWAGISYENEGTWYDVGFGFATQMSKNSYAFMDFEKSFGNDNDETYQINVGMQWSF